MTTVIALICMAALVAVDQLTKHWVIANFAVGETLPIWEGVLNFTYVRNDGAVFGSLAGKGYIFNTVTVLIVLAGIAMILLKKIEPKLLLTAATLVVAGGIGNLIDRFRFSYVVDFIDVRCFGRLWTWVFNFADCCVVIGCLLILCYYTIDLIRDYRNKSRAVAVVADERSVDTDGDADDAEA